MVQVTEYKSAVQTWNLNCFIRGDIDLSELERFKFWTDGEKHLVFLGISKCGKADEGNYRCVLTNRFGNREHKFKLFVSSEYRTDPICLSPFQF